MLLTFPINTDVIRKRSYNSHHNKLCTFVIHYSVALAIGMEAAIPWIYHHQHLREHFLRLLTE